ncbi:MAG: hypothetical protein NC419_12150, partial [Muribaculaceae bacterium]|nr:hypothetical protein [Muribaculaceae bacterium]
GKVNMCKALEDWIEEERAEGKIEGVILMCREFNLSEDATAQKLQKMFFLSEKEAKQYLKKSQNN